MRSALCGMLLVMQVVTYAQSDSLTFVKTSWTTTKIKNGIILKQAYFKSTLFQSNQNITILAVRKSKRVFSIAFEKQILKTTSAFGKEAAALAALNGTFFDMKNGGSIDYIRCNGEMVASNIIPKEGRTVHQKAAVVVRKGKISIQRWNGLPDWEQILIGDDVMVSGPLLVYESQAQKLDSIAFILARHPRAVVVTTPKQTMLVTIDGRNENAQGMSLPEVTRIVRWLGATYAINLDGGGSTTLWVYNYPGNGVVNFPCDNQKWDHEGERKVANVILVMPGKQ